MRESKGIFVLVAHERRGFYMYIKLQLFTGNSRPIPSADGRGSGGGQILDDLHDGVLNGKDSVDPLFGDPPISHRRRRRRRRHGSPSRAAEEKKAVSEVLLPPSYFHLMRDGKSPTNDTSALQVSGTALPCFRFLPRLSLA